MFKGSFGTVYAGALNTCGAFCTCRFACDTGLGLAQESWVRTEQSGSEAGSVQNRMGVVHGAGPCGAARVLCVGLYGAGWVLSLGLDLYRAG